MIAHKLRRLFPITISTLELSALKKEVRLTGFDQGSPILLFEGKILDGLTRYRISVKMDKKPFYAIFNGTGENAFGYLIRKKGSLLTPQEAEQIRDAVMAYLRPPQKPHRKRSAKWYETHSWESRFKNKTIYDTLQYLAKAMK